MFFPCLGLCRFEDGVRESRAVLDVRLAALDSKTNEGNVSLACGCQRTVFQSWNSHFSQREVLFSVVSDSVIHIVVG